MVFRRDSKVDAFQRQISALRQQLGGDHDAFSLGDREEPTLEREQSPYRSALRALDAHSSDEFDLELQAPQLAGERPPAVPAVPAADSMTSILSHTTVWTGTLESTGSLHIHGRVEGSLTARDDVFIAEEAEVEATVHAANVTIAGNVRGSIRCAERFELLPHGRVAGDVQAPVIVIHEGAAIAGQIAMTATGDGRLHSTASGSARGARGD